MVKRMVEKDFCDICDKELENLNWLCEECGKQVCQECFSIVKIYRKTKIMISEISKGIVIHNVCNECYEKKDYSIDIKTIEEVRI